MDGFDPEGAALAVADALRAVGTADRAAQEKRHLKSELEFFGVTVPEIRRVGKAAVRGAPGGDCAGDAAGGQGGGAGLPRDRPGGDGRLGGRAVAGAGP